MDIHIVSDIVQEGAVWRLQTAIYNTIRSAQPVAALAAAHRRTAPHRRTAEQPHTSARTATPRRTTAQWRTNGQPQTAVRNARLPKIF